MANPRDVGIQGFLAVLAAKGGLRIQKIRLLERIEYQGNKLEGVPMPRILSRIDFVDGTRAKE